MGLDTSASRTPVHVTLTPEDEGVFRVLDVQLCEWFGDGGFRGKLYTEVVWEIAGVRLAQEWIPPEEVARMAGAFEGCDPEAIVRTWEGYPSELTAEEIRSLRRLFRTCADRGLGLIGDY